MSQSQPNPQTPQLPTRLYASTISPPVTGKQGRQVFEQDGGAKNMQLGILFLNLGGPERMEVNHSLTLLIIVF